MSIHDGDFELWEEEKYGIKFYNLSIEGYIGLETIGDFIDLYNFFLEELYYYLLQNNYPKTERGNWNTIYKTRAIEVDFVNDCYWVFLDKYESNGIWDIYYYLEGVIEQLRQVEHDN